MKFMKSLLICLMLSAGPAIARSTADSLTHHLKEYLHKKKLPGFAVVITDKNKVVYQRGFGYADIESRIPFTTRTIQNIGSVSKTVVAVALMKAVELNYFTLESDVNEILPFRVVNPHQPQSVIRVKHLSTHTSGIIDNQSIYTRSLRFMPLSDPDPALKGILTSYGYTSDLADTTMAAFLESYLSPGGNLYNEQNFYDSEPGTRASYSNIATALIAQLIEVKAGMSFADFTEKYVIKPLRMHNTSWFLTRKNIRNHSLPYLSPETVLPFYTLTTYPDGGLRTSANDLSRYLLEMIRALNGRSDLLNPESVQTMFRPAYTPETLPANMSLQTRNKGVLWNIYNDGYIGHDGDDPGVISQILFNKERGIAFIGNMYIEDRSELVTILKRYAEKLAE